MILERLLILLGLLIVGFAAYTLWKRWQVRRLAGKVTAVAADKPTLLYFRSESCAVCPTQSRYLEQLQGMENGRLTIQKIDADRNPEQAAQYNVFSLPTTILLDTTGTVKHINFGLTNAHKLRRQMASLHAVPDLRLLENL